jgi:hypothetical protein
VHVMESTLQPQKVSSLSNYSLISKTCRRLAKGKCDLIVVVWQMDKTTLIKRSTLDKLFLLDGT